MKVLLLTNLFPSPNNNTAGIFITNRLKSAKEFGIECVPYALLAKDSPLVRLIKKLLLKKPDSFISENYTIENVQYKYIRTRRDIIDLSLMALKFWSNMFSIRTCKNLEKINALYNVNVIHAHGMYKYSPAGLIAMYLSEKYGIPFVITLHGSDINYDMPKKRKAYVKTLEKASKCIFVSNALLQKAVSYGYSGQNAVVIPNGYDPEVFKSMDKETVRKDLGIHRNNSKYVGFVGNLEYVKRADKLPEIFKNIANNLPNVKFIVIGDGTLMASMKEQLANLDVFFTGKLPQRDVAKWMNAMDVMILPSRNEGFPTVVNEAQACGTCVIGSNNGGIPEAIGFEEYTVEDGDDFEKRMAKKVVEILKNGYDSERLINKATNFTWDKIVEKEIEVYRESISIFTP